MRAFPDISFLICSIRKNELIGHETHEPVTCTTVCLQMQFTLKSLMHDSRYVTNPSHLSVNGFVIWALVSISRSNATFLLCLYLLITISKEKSRSGAKGHWQSAKKTTAGVAGTKIVLNDSEGRALHCYVMMMVTTINVLLLLLMVSLKSVRSSCSKFRPLLLGTETR